MDPIVKMWMDLIVKYLVRMPAKDRRERLIALESAIALVKEKCPI